MERGIVKIAQVQKFCVSRTIERLDNAETNRPFHSPYYLIRLFWSRFECSFYIVRQSRNIEIQHTVALGGGKLEASPRSVQVQIDQELMLP